MPEKVETQELPFVVPPCNPCSSLRTRFANPLLEKYQALDWQAISFDIPREKLIILGLSVVGIAGLYVLVRRGNLTLPGLSPYLKARNPKDAGTPTPSKLGHCKFGFQDIFDVESVITGFGSYDWEQTHTAATQTAVAVDLLLKAGAVSTGKQTMDEFGLSMFGRNKRDGTTDNPVAPKHFSGGAACGSAVAVASNAVDFAIAVDTIGGVRVPAAFCGIFGYRASHGVISTVGIIPVSPSLDVVGVLSRDPYVLHHVVKVLLQQPELEWGSPTSLLVADDCFGLSTISSVRTADLLARAVSETLGRSLVRHVNLGTHLASNIPTLRNFLMEEERLLKQDTSRYTTYDGLRDAMLLILRGEFKEKHRKWFKEVDPELSPDVDVRVRFAMSPHLDGLHRMALKVKDETRAVMNELLLTDALLVIPSTPSLPPNRAARGKELEIFESRALSILSIATMAGCCQVTIPLGTVRGIPISVSLLARYGADIFLLESLIKLNPKLQLEVDILKQKKPSMKDDHIVARNSVNERDVPTKPKPVGQVSLEQGSREEANKGNTYLDDKENSQPKEKKQDVPESPRVYRM
ncbi:hypothetical protein KC19_11G101400 [Ceratodon purpureus]|uniref:Amidase domain-containing protein n=1 Tax=Ceratodon purpureus TaxID=3225 RepID=A0A8T0GDJ4_CERPU|nr:hypothetical protein KC19_11G101400 [Ceratodon purpureus]